jgi:phosphopantothenoylcysteine decarboxylase/phosphopantothenate--cysteine ligase
VAEGKTILLVVTGGIAVYKALDLVRRLKERGHRVRVTMTAGAQKFVTPLAFAAVSNELVASDLFDVNSEHEIGHIRASREADLVVVAPATAHILARMAHGLADDLATATLLATDKPVLIAPAMNSRMWAHPATQRNLTILKGDGIHVVGPNVGEMAEKGEAGAGRMSEPLEIVSAVEALLAPADRPLAGKRILVTSGPTHEPIDPVRYIANRSSGKQGHAIAAAAAALGAEVTLVSGPVTLADPKGVRVVHVETAREMLAAVEASLPADAAVFAAAVADWRVAEAASDKIKKGPDGAPALAFVENPDILATVGHHATLRPRLVVGFAAETRDLLANASVKLARKGADVIVANDVAVRPDGSGVMGGDANTVRLVEAGGVTDWPEMPKEAVAARLVRWIADRLASG